jgi:ATP-dependent protease ClpP protease subunit
LTFDASSSDGKTVITLTGTIEAGDSNRFRALTASLGSGTTIVKLDSDGGSVREAVTIATTIKNSHLVTLVPPNSDCASACFFIFATGERRYAADSAFIGVHSATTSGLGEDDTAKSVTVEMVRFLSEKLGVPDSIIGKIVKTPAESVARLSEADLAAMGVKIFYEDLASIIPFPASPPKPVLPAPKPVLPQPQEHFLPGSVSLCGRAVSYTIASDDTGYAGIWTGNWNNATQLCGGLILEKVDANGMAEVIYVYGPSQPGSKVHWKQQRATGILADHILRFRDDQGSIFSFSFTGAEGVRARFEGASGRLTALFQRISPSSVYLGSTSPGNAEASGR